MERPFTAYILRCSDGSFYTGHTDDISQRVAEHRHGEGCAWTRDRLPVELVWSQDFPTREEAKAAEHRIKGWSRAKKEALIAGRFDLLRALSSRGQAGRAVRDALK